MKNFNYTADIHYQIASCYLTDSFTQLEKAAKGFQLSGRHVIMIAEKTYLGFYKEQLEGVFNQIAGSFDIFEIESEPVDFAAEKEKLVAFAEEKTAVPAKESLPTTDKSNGLANCCIVSLGGHKADILSRSFIAAQDEKILYIQLPVTFTSQLIAGKDAAYVLEAAPDVYGELTEKALLVKPELIYINIHAYKYLSVDERLSGMGEVLRYAVSSDRQLFEFIESNAGKNTDNFSAFLMTLIGNCVQGEDKTTQQKKPDKNETISAEAEGKQNGTCKHPIFGFTIARALEKCTNYIIPHGSAAGIGMVVANSISAKRNLLDNDINFRIARLMVTYGLSVSMNFTNALIDAICASIEAVPGLVDENGRLKEFVLLTKLGKTVKVDDVTLDEIRDVMNYRKISR